LVCPDRLCQIQTSFVIIVSSILALSSPDFDRILRGMLNGRDAAEILEERETIAAQYPDATILSTLFQPTQYAHPLEFFDLKAASLEQLVAEDTAAGTVAKELADHKTAIRNELTDRLGVGSHPIGSHRVSIYFMNKLAVSRLAEDYPQEVMPEIYKTEISNDLCRKHFSPALLEEQYEIKAAAPTVKITEAKGAKK